MRLRQVSVTYERKLNLGDYQSAHIGATLWADLDESDNEPDAVKLLQETARAHVKSEVLRLMKPSKPEAETKP